VWERLSRSALIGAIVREAAHDSLLSVDLEPQSLISLSSATAVIPFGDASELRRVFEHEEGWLWVYVPDLPGCASRGETYDEASATPPKLLWVRRWAGGGWSVRPRAAHGDCDGGEQSALSDLFAITLNGVRAGHRNIWQTS
jgi:hypothetical protein